MDDEEIRRRIRRAILTAFDKWGSQNFDVLFDPRTRKENPEKYENDRLDDAFMRQRIVNLGLFRTVTKQVVASENSLRQFLTLTKAAILSMLHPTISVGQIETKSKEDGLYTRRHIQDIVRRIFSETFFETDKKDMEPEVANTVSPYSTVFSPHIEPKLDNPAIVRKFRAMDRAAMNNNPGIREGIILSAQMQEVFPEYLESLLSFTKLCNQILVGAADYSQTGKILTQELGEFTESLQIFHNHMLSIISIEWYRSRQQETRKELFKRTHALEYTSQDASLAAAQLMELTNEEQWSADTLAVAGMAFIQYGRSDISAILFTECLKFNELTPYFKGAMHENLATIFRDSSPPKSKLMVVEMKKAVQLYRESGDLYRVCVALKNLGEAEWRLGYKLLGLQYFEEAYELRSKLAQPDSAAVLLNLAVSARRVEDRKLETRYLVDSLKECPDDWTERILAINQRLSELSN